MSSQHVLVAGANGVLGQALVAELARRGYRVRAISRTAAFVPGASETVRADLHDDASLRAACHGVDAVFSAAGASLALTLRPRSPGFRTVDFEGNRRLLAAAKAAGVRRFGYVSVFHTPAQADLAYVRAHTDFEALLRGSGLESVIVRPTGFFDSFLPLLAMARWGVAPLLGTGAATTNPIHSADLAAVCADALEGPPGLTEAGGPDVLSRRDAFEVAFKTLGKQPRFVRLPLALLRFNAALIRPLDARLSDVLRFFARVSTTDAVAPARGQRHLRHFFREHAGHPVTA